MKPIALLAETTTPAGDHLALHSHDGNYFLKLNGAQVMTSFAHGAEDELARQGCAPVQRATKPQVFIGGLGMGYTLAEACRALPQKGAQFTVAERLPELVQWNKSHLGHLHPGLWEDSRVAIYGGDFGDLMAGSPEAFHVILLDTQSGPEGISSENNDALYTIEGLQRLAAALKQGGLLAIWSADDDQTLERRLREVGFDVNRVEAPAAHRGKRKRQHSICLARNGQYEAQHRSQHS